MFTDGDKRFPEPLGRWQRVLVTLRLGRSFAQSRTFPYARLLDCRFGGRASGPAAPRQLRPAPLARELALCSQNAHGPETLACPALVSLAGLHPGTDGEDPDRGHRERRSCACPAPGSPPIVAPGLARQSPTTWNRPTIRSTPGGEVVRFLASVPILFIVWSRPRNRDDTSIDSGRPQLGFTPGIRYEVAMFELLDDWNSILNALIAAPIAWQSPAEIASGAGPRI